MNKIEERILELITRLKEEMRINDLRVKQLSVGGGSGGGGDMYKAVYDTDNDGVVDNAEKLGGKTESQLNVDKVDGYDASAFALYNHTHTGMGDMLKSVYDTDDDGVVDNAERIDGRKIYVENRPPEPEEGSDGDIWIQYKES